MNICDIKIGDKLIVSEEHAKCWYYLVTEIRRNEDRVVVECRKTDNGKYQNTYTSHVSCFCGKINPEISPGDIRVGMEITVLYRKPRDGRPEDTSFYGDRMIVTNMRLPYIYVDHYIWGSMHKTVLDTREVTLMRLGGKDELQGLRDEIRALKDKLEEARKVFG